MKKGSTVYLRTVSVSDVSSSGVLNVGDVVVAAPRLEQLLVGGPRGASSFAVQPAPRSYTQLHFANHLDRDDEDQNILLDENTPDPFGTEKGAPPAVLNEDQRETLEYARFLDRQPDLETDTSSVVRFGDIRVVAVTNSGCLLIGRHDIVLPSAILRTIGVLPSAAGAAATGATGPAGPVGAIP